MSYKRRVQINCSRSGKVSLCKVVTDYKNDDRLEETVTQLVTSVKKLEKVVCQCHDRLLSPGPHYVPREEEMVEDSEEGEEDEEEENGLEYETDTPSKDSYMTPPSTGGCSDPSLAPTCSPTPEDSDPENNAVLCTEELEACIKVFLEEAEEDMEMNDLPLLENVSPLPVLAPVIPGFVPFAVSTGQHCVPPKSLLTLGARGPGTSDYMLRTLGALVE